MSRTDGMHTIDPNAPGAVEALLDFHRGLHGRAQMNGNESGDQNQDGPPDRPEGVSEEEWDALGDPGKRAIVRERDRASRAEQALATARAAKPAPPKPKEEQKPADKPAEQKPAGGEPDFAALIQQAVTAAIAPFQEREQQREAEAGARRVTDAVTEAAKARLHDPSDALAHIDLTGLTDGTGSPDAAKITAAIEDLAVRKPHLAKVVDDRRRPVPGSFIGAGAGPVTSTDDLVKSALAQMQQSTGVKLATSE